MLNRFRHGLFDLCVSQADNGLFDSDRYTPVKTIRADRNFFAFSPVDVDADPYLFVHDDTLFLFYEEQEVKRNGRIKMIKTRDLLHWSAPVTVLKENFHLSYPYVFNDCGQIYMMPETGEDGSVRIYRPCNDMLTEWILCKKLLSGHAYMDSSVLVFGEVYYLFTTVNTAGRYELKLYTAGSLEGDWKEHPASPVCIGNEAARCGGAVFKYENSIYRPAQKCVNSYGEALAIYMITELTPESYREEIVCRNILSPKDPFYKHGGHHLTHVFFRDALIVATDARGSALNIFAFAKRLFVLLKRRLGIL